MKILNRKAYHDFTISTTYIAGIVLEGAEVKSIRKGDATISFDSFVFIKDGEVFVKNLKVAKYKESFIGDKFDEARDKKLLLNKREISQIEIYLQDKSTTIVPLELFTQKGLFKLKIGIAKGKKNWNKKEDLKKKDVERQIKRDFNMSIK